MQIDTIGETGSTNADLAARLLAGETLAEGYWLVADRQTAGRGRQGRQWLDTPGNFMGSTVVTLRADDPPAMQLSMVAALALLETVMQRLADPSRVRLKWPNDVLLDGAKFSGILLERVKDHAVIGIGVNLVAAPPVEGRETRALSALGPAPQRDAFARDLAAAFASEVARWRSHSGDDLRTRWLAAAHPLGTPLSVHDERGLAVSGQFAGLADDGALILRLDDGSQRVIHAGDVTEEKA
ncbi:biotin--[acetyl-CoA-carboxylase] ligase [Aurantiacibacter xanthus]|uniref:biotin--[biotin carboxyl-carrier protein] ligase n=1 Tax=Aurantiacibacter xanthus TaxID=1784712 RepID=A0A3A1P921_9SPHN|nr:biotin--[acetyl-CoA-carboxylase] ligase [Aurantiacibacter xanthus]RIV89479.1 biotin--[acetyl-CoA-carboxylase] ligase [Aurantiacibacter xanthus]